jgi:membrane peptidoglycan carboxypeptidase
LIKLIKKLFLILLIALVIVSAVILKKGHDLFEEALEETSIKDKIVEIKENTENYTTYDELPQKYIDAVISVEDRRFFYHSGIDLISIGRAIAKDITTLKLAEGGSTITQQLAKNTYFNQKKEFTRKIAEIFMANEFEKECSKEEIFELYVNTIYYGDGYYSIKDASRGYFDKEPSEMNMFEMTLLAGIPNAPSVYSPSVNPELSKERHSKVLNKMVSYGYITKEEADSIMSEYDK